MGALDPLRGSPMVARRSAPDPLGRAARLQKPSEETVKAPTSFLLALLTFFVVALVVGAAMFFLVMLVAGPHTDLLTTNLRAAVIVLAWLVVGVVPALIAFRVFRRLRAVHEH